MKGYLAAIAALSVVCEAAGAPVVQTKQGAVEGKADLLSGLDVWHSIPFAEPPVGDLRFKAPVAKSAWSGTLDAKKLPESCPQFMVGDIDNKTITLGAEDCLYLNVYRPIGTRADEKLPVMFWIYGGGYSLGSGYEFDWYNPAKLIKEHKVIVVAPNYRLSALGFLDLDSLRSEDGHGVAGSQALLDQRLAMQWTQQNIAAFGGDPDRVAIFGESAGGFSVCWHLASPGSAGLFHAAIMESGSCDSPQFFRSIPRQQSWAHLFAESVGCPKPTSGSDDSNVLECLRSKPLHDLLRPAALMVDPAWPFESPVGERLSDQALLTRAMASSNPLGLLAAMQRGEAPVAGGRRLRGSGGLPGEHHGYLPAIAPVMPWGTSVGGPSYTMPDLPINMIRAGKHNRVPVIFGTNKDEGMIFIPALVLMMPGEAWFPPSEKAIERGMKKLMQMYDATTVDNVIQEAFQLYPASSFDGSETKRVAAILRDYFFTCGTRRSIRAVASQQQQPAFLYQFTQNASNWVDYRVAGDYHSLELNFVFHPWPPILRKFNSDEAMLSKEMHGYWTSMAYNGEPNTGKVSTAPVWPQYNATTDQNLYLQEPGLKAGARLYQSKCDFWDTAVQKLQAAAPPSDDDNYVHRPW